MLKSTARIITFPTDRIWLSIFPRALARTPAPQRMAVKKSPDTYRIFMFGESAAMGDPDSSFGAWRLPAAGATARTFPGTKFEVICVAIMADRSDVTSLIARRFARATAIVNCSRARTKWSGALAGHHFSAHARAGVGLIRPNPRLKTTRIGSCLEQWRRTMEVAFENRP